MFLSFPTGYIYSVAFAVDPYANVEILPFSKFINCISTFFSILNDLMAYITIHATLKCILVTY